jgi:ComF family protein
MLTIIDRILGYVAPHECLGCAVEGAILCPPCTQLLPDLVPGCYRCGHASPVSQTCSTCRKHTALEHVWLSTPYESFGQELVRKLKFGRAAAAADPIAQSLTSRFDTLLSREGVLVPIPTATSRVRQRGYDQTLLITQLLSKYTALPYVQALERSGQQRQTGTSRAQRLAQLEYAFQAKAKKLKEVNKIILIDDVLTTGATIESAAGVLKQAGVTSISALVFARTQ